MTLTGPRADATRARAFGSCAMGGGRSFGSVRVAARVNGVPFATSVFRHGESQGHLLPVKAGVRRVAGIAAGDRVEVEISA